MNSLRRRVYAVGLSLGAACSSSFEPHDAIELETEVNPGVVVTGDTVTFRGILWNPTNTEIDAGLACGPPVLFELRRLGQLVHPIPLDAPFACPGLDYRVLEPNETDTVTVRWRVVLAPGEWSVRSGFRKGAGLDRLSPAVPLIVEAP